MGSSGFILSQALVVHPGGWSLRFLDPSSHTPLGLSVWRCPRRLASPGGFLTIHNTDGVHPTYFLLDQSFLLPCHYHFLPPFNHQITRIYITGHGRLFCSFLTVIYRDSTYRRIRRCDKMMYPSYGVQTLDAIPVSYPQDVFFDDLSTQMTVSQARRLSRSSYGHQRAGSAMRIVKPTSANNSPRSSMLLNRRRTMMAESWASRQPQQQVMDYLSITHGVDAMPSRTDTGRPLSWHPSSHQQQLQHQQPQQSYYQYQQQQNQHPQQQMGYPFPTPSMYAERNDLYYGPHPQFSPMMASYSNDTSPSSTFSPLPSSSVEAAQYMTTGMFNHNGQRATPLLASTNNGQVNEPFPVLDGTTTEKGHAPGGLDWNSFIMQGFNNTSPPTPETFSQSQQPQPAVSETSMPYQALDEPEEEGEILVGMGLYDTPDKFDQDPQLDNYRYTASSLLGPSFRLPEARGKGLKLEETWEPPKSEPEEEEEDDE